MKYILTLSITVLFSLAGFAQQDKNDIENEHFCSIQ